MANVFLENNQEYILRGKEELETFDIDNREEFTKKVYEQELNKEGENEVEIDINQEQENALRSIGNVDLNNPEVQKLVQQKIEKMKIMSSKFNSEENASKEELSKTKNDIFAQSKKDKHISEKTLKSPKNKRK